MKSRLADSNLQQSEPNSDKAECRLFTDKHRESSIPDITSLDELEEIFNELAHLSYELEKFHLIE